ncbi:axin-1-like [Pseudorasbora parva]|uniref:axin-1-like n=1 Tax=Pseudorasbora parva TaxID=51549 RepID=UPI00351F5029
MRRLQELQIQTQDTREEERGMSSRCVTVVYYYSGDAIPYRTCVCGDPAVTLGRFKSLLTRRGPFRFYFQSASAEFECGAVYEEIREDAAILPTFERKIIARVERTSDPS